MVGQFSLSRTEAATGSNALSDLSSRLRSPFAQLGVQLLNQSVHDVPPIPFSSSLSPDRNLYLAKIQPNESRTFSTQSLLPPQQPPQPRPLLRPTPVISQCQVTSQ